MGRSVLSFAFFFVLLTLMLMFDGNLAFKAHRDRGGSRREHESLLDKQERDRNEKERKKDDDKKEEKRNITCYKCAGDQCNDPFRFENSTPIVLCEFGCWKGVFAAAVRRGCGSKRCTVTFQGGSAISNTCCQTDRCNRTSIQRGSFLLLVVSLIGIMANIRGE